MFLTTNIKFEPGSVKRNFCRSILTVYTTCTISLLPGNMKVNKPEGSRRNIKKQRKNHHKLITKCTCKASFLSHNTKIFSKNFSYVHRSRKYWECKYKIMKGHNQRGNGNDITFTFLHFVQLMYGTSELWTLFNEWIFFIHNGYKWRHNKHSVDVLFCKLTPTGNW